MTGVIGMDPGEVRDLARMLDASSRSLEDMAVIVGAAARATSWAGPDAELFRHAWGMRHAPALRLVSAALQESARTALADADQQDDASSPGPSAVAGRPSRDDNRNPLRDRLGDLWDDVAEGVDGAVDTVGDGATEIGDWAEDGLHWATGTIGDSVRWVDTHVDEVVDYVGDGIREAPDELRESVPDLEDDLDYFSGLTTWGPGGEPPSVMQVLAAGGLVLGSAGNLAYRLGTVGTPDPHFLDDGRAEVGEAIPLRVMGADAREDEGDGRAPAVVPSSLAAIARGTAQGYLDASVDPTGDGAVRITTVTGSDGPSYIVSIPGTQSWALSSDMPADLTGNLQIASGQSSTAAEAVRLAMIEAGVPADAPVLLSGHSQGGMIAMQLAGDPTFREQFDVTSVMTFGSPIDGAAVPDTIDVLAFQHASDAVPQLDLAGLRVDGTVPRPSGADVVTLPDPAGSTWYDVEANHDFNAYVGSIAAAEEPGGPATAYGQDSSFGRFLTTDEDAVSAVVVPTGRRD